MPLGVHFALTDVQAHELKRRVGDAARLAFLHETLEPYFFDHAQQWKAESDKAWDAIHRALTDGGLSASDDRYPLSHAVLGGEQLHAGSHYIMSLNAPEQVREVARALDQVTQDEFRRRYFAIDRDEYGFEPSDADFHYSWEWFEVIRTLWRNAAVSGLHVLFTADQ